MAELVTLLDDESDGLALAETGDVVSDIDINGEAAVQRAGGIRALNGQAFARGNVFNQLTVAITHEPSNSPDEAKESAVDRIAAVTAKIATATMLELIFGANTYRLSDVALQSYRIRPLGVTVFATYNFIGGAIAKVEAP